MGSLDGERSVRESANRDMPQKNVDYPLNGKNEPPSKEEVFPKGAENWRWGQPLHWAILCSLSAAGRKAFHKLLSLKTPSLWVPKTMAGLTNVLTPAVCMLPFSRVWPFQDLMDCSPPGSSVHGVLQARIQEWASISFSRGSSLSKDRTHVSCNAGRFLTTEPTGIPNVLWEHAAAAVAKSLQSCPTLCDPIDGSPPGSPVPGILQARTLEWVAISFSNG